jgi:hypothetical protein
LFSVVRIKIKCKNPSKIPPERVYEMGGGCYLVSFRTEGVVQESNKPEGEDDNGDDEDPEDDDLLGDDLGKEHDTNPEAGDKEKDPPRGSGSLGGSGKNSKLQWQVCYI